VLSSGVMNSIRPNFKVEAVRQYHLQYSSSPWAA